MTYAPLRNYTNSDAAEAADASAAFHAQHEATTVSDDEAESMWVATYPGGHPIAGEACADVEERNEGVGVVRWLFAATALVALLGAAALIG